MSERVCERARPGEAQAGVPRRAEPIDSDRPSPRGQPTRGWLFALIAIAACGSKGDRTDKKAPEKPDRPPPSVDAGSVTGTSDAAPAPPLALGALAGKLPKTKVDGTKGPPATPPAAAVLIRADGSLAVGATGASWERVLAEGFAADAPAVTLGELPRALLDVLAGAEGEVGQHAKEMRAELDLIGTQPDLADEDEVAMTYFDELGADTADVTPLVIADPKAPGARLAEVLDKVGGIVVVERSHALGVLSLAAPWDHVMYGGLEPDEELPAIDVEVGSGWIAMAREDDEEAEPPVFQLRRDPVSEELRYVTASFAPDQRWSADVLVTSDAAIQNVVEAVTFLQVGGAKVIGVGVSPWPPTFASGEGQMIPVSPKR
jgi:hypothetical protein